MPQGCWHQRGVDWGVLHRLVKGTSVSKNAGPRRGWIVRSILVDWGGERSILYKNVETSPYQTLFKNLVRKFERESPSTSGELGPLHLFTKGCSIPSGSNTSSLSFSIELAKTTHHTHKMKQSI